MSQTSPSLFFKKLDLQFSEMLLQNLDNLSEHQPYLDDEELEDKAYELTSLQIYYQALNFLDIKKRQDAEFDREVDFGRIV